MSVVYSSPEATAPVLASPWPAADDSRIRHAVRRAAAVPLGVTLVVQWVVLVAWGLPEARGLPARSWWLVQLAPLGLSAGHRLGAAVLLLCAAALVVASRTRHWVGRATMTLPALLGSACAALVLARLLVERALGASALGVVLLLVWVVSAWYAALHALLVDLGPAPAPTRRTGALLLAGWVLLLPGPLALGRLLLARDLRTEAGVLAANTVALRLGGLLSGASVRLYLFGVLLGVVVWLGFQGWPRRGTSRSWRWYVALSVALVLLTQLWWSAQTSAARRVTELRFGTPVADLHLTCATSVYPPAAGTPAETPTVTVAVSGLSCRTVTTYVGYRQLGTTSAEVSVSPVALRTLRSGTGSGSDPVPVARATTSLAGARYGGVLVLGGTDRVDRVVDQLVAVPLRGGPALWHFTCADKREVRARFPGGRTDPASPTTTPGEPGAVVVLTCGAEQLRLNPVTGLSG